jgi:uncharacterized protein
MNSEADRAVLSRTVRVDDIRGGASGEIAVTKAEMDAIAGMLDLVALEGLTFNYRLDHGGGGRVHLTGRLHANVTQTCVVSLDPVEANLDVPVEVEFWPVSLIDELERSTEEPGTWATRLARGGGGGKDRSRAGHLRDRCHGARALPEAGGGKLRLVARPLRRGG